MKMIIFGFRQSLYFEASNLSGNTSLLLAYNENEPILKGGIAMILDKRAIEMLLQLDDAKLILVIKKLAADAGIDPSSLKISEKEIAGIRAALSSATDGDLSRAGELLKEYKNGKKLK